MTCIRKPIPDRFRALSLNLTLCLQVVVTINILLSCMLNPNQLNYVFVVMAKAVDGVNLSFEVSSFDSMCKHHQGRGRGLKFSFDNTETEAQEYFFSRVLEKGEGVRFLCQLAIEEEHMEAEIKTFAEALVASAHERVSQKLHNRPWLEIVDEWSRTRNPDSEEQLHAINKELAREVLLYLGDELAKNLELPLH